jgi:hypothetical protein
MAEWRTGVKVPHNLYEGDEPRGMLLDPLVAARIAAAMNGIERAHKILSESRPVDSAVLRLAHDLREALGGSGAPPDDQDLSPKRETEEEGNTP